ncbi:SCO2322 family protein [Streptomyces chattanoogensis]|uniref:SCO2322 family protein n=1 Tax=Streptomyces chattanoogensis TaxID=66876 RepID=UPI0006B53F0C|nr:SCO2322 family protein [Streptomyces chattanoogensis]
MRCRRAVGALLLAGAVTGLAAAPVQAQAQAQAETLSQARAQAQEYRYWSFWDSKGGSWSYASEGPATARPADGSVQGFRFTVSADSAAAGKPRAAADFDALCQGTPAREGSKRIGVVIDFGTAADAPDGETPPKARTECARVPEDASAGDALAAVARRLRYDSNALLCAIAGYPKSGCAEQVSGSGGAGGSGGARKAPSSPSAKAADGDGDGGPSAGLLGGIAAVVVLGAAAVWQARRRRG